MYFRFFLMKGKGDQIRKLKYVGWGILLRGFEVLEVVTGRGSLGIILEEEGFEY